MGISYTASESELDPHLGVFFNLLLCIAIIKTHSLQNSLNIFGTDSIIESHFNKLEPQL